MKCGRSGYNPYQTDCCVFLCCRGRVETMRHGFETCGQETRYQKHLPEGRPIRACTLEPAKEWDTLRSGIPEREQRAHDLA